MVERASVRGFREGWNWFFFDLIFKPAAVCAIVVLERYFSYRVKFISTRSALKIGSMSIASRRTLGPTTAHIVMVKAMSLFVHFCEADNAYGLAFDAFIDEYNSQIKLNRLDELRPKEAV